MKKLLCVLLSFAMAVSIITASSASAFAQSNDSTYSNDALIEDLEHIVDELEIKQAQKPEIAPTSARTFLVSENPKMSYDEIDGYIYGYIGDADFDDAVSIMDATAVQRHIAQANILVATACKLGDADMDGELSVMDATAIQLYIAGKPNSKYVYHILYSSAETALVDTFDEIGEFVMNNGKFSESDGDYYIDSTQTIEGVEVYTRIGHYPDTYNVSEPYITVLTIMYMPENDSYCKLFMHFSRGSKKFSFYTTEYTDDFTLYQLWGDATVENITEDYGFEFNFVKNQFVSDYGVQYEQVEEILPSMYVMNLMLAEEHITHGIVGSILDLVYDLTLLV